MALPIITNNVDNTTLSTEDKGGGAYNIILTAHENFIFDKAPSITYTQNKKEWTDYFYISTDKKTANRKIKADEGTSATINGVVIQSSEPHEPTITNTIKEVEFNYTWKNNILTIKVTAPVGVNARLDSPKVEYTDTKNVPTHKDMEVQGDPVNITATVTIDNLGGDYSVIITGTYIRILPITKLLTNCTSETTIPDYVDFDSLIKVTLIANDNTEFHKDDTTYLSVVTIIDGDEIKTPFYISSDKNTATISYQLENSSKYSGINIVGECFPKQIIAQQYGSINVYLVTLDNLKDFASKRYFIEQNRNIDLGDYVNRIKRIYTNITPFSSDVIRCGNYNTGIACKQPSGDKITLDFGTAQVPAHNKDNTDFESKLQIFLPFAGFVTLNGDYAGQTISLQYVINVVTGNGVALLSCNGVVFQVEEIEPSSEIIYLSPSTQVKTIGGDDWNEMLYYGLEPYIYCNWYESASTGRNTDRQKGIIGDFRGFNIFDDVTPIHTAEMLTEEQEMIYTALSDGVYIE